MKKIIFIFAVVLLSFVVPSDGIDPATVTDQLLWEASHNQGLTIGENSSAGWDTTFADVDAGYSNVERITDFIRSGCLLKSITVYTTDDIYVSFWGENLNCKYADVDSILTRLRAGKTMKWDWVNVDSLHIWSDNDNTSVDLYVRATHQRP